MLAAAVSAETATAEDLYLRAGFGLDRPTETVFRDKNCEIEAPVPLYGCGPAPDGAPYRSVGNFGTVAALEVGIGTTVAPAVRIEALVEVRPSLTFSGRANYLDSELRQSVSVDLSVVSGMVAAYVDLPALGLPRLGPFDPFVGAGVGAARVRAGETRMMFPATTTIVPGVRRSNFAWMVTAGVATVLSESTTLDLAWRYSDLGAPPRPPRAAAGWCGATGAGSRSCSIRPRARPICEATDFVSPCVTNSDWAWAHTVDSAAGLRHD